MNLGPNPKEQRILQEKEDAELLAAHFAIHQKQLDPPVNLGEAGPEITEFKNMIASFESTHSLDELHSIIEISPELALLFKYADDLASPQKIEDAIACYKENNPPYVEVYKKKIAEARAITLIPEENRKFKIRMEAKKEIAPIVAKLNIFKGNKRYEELRAEYMRLARAIGIIGRDNKIDHNR